MDDYTALDCTLAEKRFKATREYELNNLRLVLTSVINTTAQKKSDVKKPEDIMELEMDRIKAFHSKKKVVKTANKRTARKLLDAHRKAFPSIEIPKSLMTKKELQALEN